MVAKKVVATHPAVGSHHLEMSSGLIHVLTRNPWPCKIKGKNSETSRTMVIFGQRCQRGVPVFTFSGGAPGLVNWCKGICMSRIIFLHQASFIVTNINLYTIWRIWLVKDLYCGTFFFRLCKNCVPLFTVFVWISFLCDWVGVQCTPYSFTKEGVVVSCAPLLLKVTLRFW